VEGGKKIVGEKEISIPRERIKKSIMLVRGEKVLYGNGYIGNPKTEAKSVTLTEQGERLSEELFKKHFGLTSKSQE
jgi:hypothetical protein